MRNIEPITRSYSGQLPGNCPGGATLRREPHFPWRIVAARREPSGVHLRIEAARREPSGVHLRIEAARREPSGVPH